MIGKLMSTGDAARALGCSAEWVRILEKTGRLNAGRIAGGRLVFDAS